MQLVKHLHQATTHLKLARHELHHTHDGARGTLSQLDSGTTGEDLTSGVPQLMVDKNAVLELMSHLVANPKSTKTGISV